MVRIDTMLVIDIITHCGLYDVLSVDAEPEGWYRIPQATTSGARNDWSRRVSVDTLTRDTILTTTQDFQNGPVIWALGLFPK